MEETFRDYLASKIFRNQIINAIYTIRILKVTACFLQEDFK